MIRIWNIGRMACYIDRNEERFEDCLGKCSS